MLDGRSVPDRGVQPAVVEPADIGDGRELELRAGSPHAIGDQLGLERVHERFGERVVERRQLRLMPSVSSEFV